MAKYISTYACQINCPTERQSWMYERDNLPDFNEMMNEVKQWSNQNNKYLIRHTRTHNLLLMGKTRTGKTTIAKVIENPCYIPPDRKIYSETKQITIHSVSTTLINSNNIYSFNIIDTPGMFDKVKQQNKTIKNDKIKRTIDKCMEQDVTNIHLFAFVINLQTNLDIEDIYSMIFVKENYPFLHEYICLIVTHSEETNWQQREDKINDFFQSDLVQKNNLKDFFGKKVFFMGSLRPELVNYPNKQSVREQIINVHQMRDIFIDYIIHLDSNHFFNIHHVNMPNNCQIL
ncbi:unnamed protein product [Rotaria socialis]|uniref:AIG1-type G domain-containing protein n=2 Tax=Rotaria TaxID=231623 RepID=A0A815VAU8_9BILA|nr:unnamed protein product [Rotaria magnacalcarata]CAF3121838.1 unnamed protein product [Rotaria socialis]CAF1530065.1 unnamed protein product [Rotaria magnacalcarata]CAF2213794.1 unnamed protein product [Rotaria magnacalcarata]CAF3305794.1 unnamed protein product [Rotaria socialis]